MSSYALVLNDGETIMLEAALKEMIRNCDFELSIKKSTFFNI